MRTLTSSTLTVIRPACLIKGDEGQHQDCLQLATDDRESLASTLSGDSLCETFKILPERFCNEANRLAGGEQRKKRKRRTSLSEYDLC